MSDTRRGPSGPPATDPAYLRLLEPKPTGRLLVSFESGVPVERCASAMAEALNVTAAELAPAMGGNARLLSDFAMAVVTPPSRFGQASAMSALAARAEVKSSRPEFYLFASETVADTAERSWGVAATRAFESRWTGKGIRVAVLDTGIDANHPDLPASRIVSESFVEGQTAEDVQGHGTHCAGTVAASPATETSFRYSVAPEATLYVGKVLNDKGAGREADIIAGIAWAIREGCEIVSISLGRAVRPGEETTPEYEEIARLALDRGTLIVAAAGNDSTRQYGFVAPVSEPANAPSILAVAALDVDLSVAPFSNGARNPRGGAVDIAAPGVAVMSSVPGPRLYERLSGTSMACPHVAGIAALWAESDPALRGQALWDRLREAARPLPLDERDVGAGLAQAPVEEGVPVA